MTYTKKLQKAIRSTHSCLCVGLDPNLALMPDPVKKYYDGNGERVFAFLKKVIDVTAEHCAAYKPNLGFFEALGSPGLVVFREILDYIPTDKIVIADAKRGDISSTAEHYAKAYFETFDVDAITVNPLMGFETLDPFLNYSDKAIYTLTLTSNPGASDFLLKPFAGQPSMAEYIASGLSELQPGHHSHLGMVIGATKGGQITDVIRHHPGGSLLIPGIGAQGGSVEEINHALSDHNGIPLINSSRSIIYAGTNREKWYEQVELKAKSLKKELTTITEKYV